MPPAPILIRRSSPSLSVDDGIAIELPPLDDIAFCWPIIEPILRRATRRVRGYEPIDILCLLMAGQMNLFVIRDEGAIVAVAVTQVHVYPRCRVLEVPFIAGTGLKRCWRRVLDALDAQAESLGCVDIAGWDRKGWSQFGFEITGVSLTRRLKD
jgi:hypothetical protein